MENKMTEEEKKEPTLSFAFRWLTISPDPHSVTMRNQLAPEDIFVKVDVPLKNRYIYNSEDVIKGQLDADLDVPKRIILTAEGMKYCIDQLKYQQAQDQPIEEDFSEEEWDEGDPEFDNDDGVFDWEEE